MGEPLRPQFRSAGDEIRRSAQTARQFGELTAVVAIRAADHNDNIRLRRQVAQRLLTILGWLTHRIDKMNVRLREAPAHRLDQFAHPLQRLRRLRDDAEP